MTTPEHGSRTLAPLAVQGDAFPVIHAQTDGIDSPGMDKTGCAALSYSDWLSFESGRVRDDRAAIEAGPRTGGKGLPARALFSYA